MQKPKQAETHHAIPYLESKIDINDLSLLMRWIDWRGWSRLHSEVSEYQAEVANGEESGDVQLRVAAHMVGDAKQQVTERNEFKKLIRNESVSSKIDKVSTVCYSSDGPSKPKVAWQ
jgi:hypothetical protein